MKKSKLFASIACAATLLTGFGATNSSATTFQNVKQGSPVVSVTNGKKMISSELVNQVAKEHGLPTVTNDQTPTITQVNKALASIKVSKDNPSQTVDLGNGFSVKAEVTVSQGLSSRLASKNLAYSSSQSKTATATISYSYLGITWYKLSVSENFTYNGQKITYFSGTPSVNAYGFVGWSASVSDKYIADLDPSAKDAIGDAIYSYLKLGGTTYGHIELRFTGTGNYYIHDSYFD